MNHLRQVLSADTPELEKRARLDRAALDLARIQFPDLEPQPFLDQLNELASHLGDRLRNFNDGRDFVEKAQSYLFGELGFRGNQTDFYDPLNSCLNQVLERHIGIPITLSVLYMEIARRLQMPVFGIGLPRHFILEFNDGNYATYIDPFNGGEAISTRQCYALAGAEIADPSLLKRVTKKQIVMRMLQNLHGAYLRLTDIPRAIETLDFLLLGAPETSAWYKRRGMLRLEAKRYMAAREDLNKYLSLEPDTTDRDAVLKQLQAIHMWLAQVS